jgi:hypothetical protein
VVPLGLTAVVRAITGHAPATSAEALATACDIVRLLHEALQAAGRAAHLNVSLDSPGTGLRELLTPPGCLDAGMSCADALAPLDRQLTAAGALHGIAGQGTAIVLLPHDRKLRAEELVELLQTAWRRTELVRVVFQQAQPAMVPATAQLY